MRLKTHLLRHDELVTLCGLDQSHFTTAWLSTMYPEEIDCKACRKAYEANVTWYWMNRTGFVPPAAQYSTIDQSIPGVFLTLLRR